MHQYMLDRELFSRLYAFGGVEEEEFLWRISLTCPLNVSATDMVFVREGRRDCQVTYWKLLPEHMGEPTPILTQVDRVVEASWVPRP